MGVDDVEHLPLLMNTTLMMLASKSKCRAITVMVKVTMMKRDQLPQKRWP
jgi:hypothetical protein